ncbi:MAG TPA: hypothetical protein P5149_12910, partial [Candidatus Competibacteraceae bacterium]|nr:hypothetical protein [Candidatus Competibacteraceae bacterium]
MLLLIIGETKCAIETGGRAADRYLSTIPWGANPRMGFLWYAHPRLAQLSSGQQFPEFTISTP